MKKVLVLVPEGRLEDVSTGFVIIKRKIEGLFILVVLKINGVLMTENKQIRV